MMTEVVSSDWDLHVKGHPDAAASVKALDVVVKRLERLERRARLPEIRDEDTSLTAVAERSPDTLVPLHLASTIFQMVLGLGLRVKALEARPAGLKYCGVHDGLAAYELGDCVTWDGSMWICRERVAAGPHPGQGSTVWTLAVKRGRDARRLEGRRRPRSDSRPDLLALVASCPRAIQDAVRAGVRVSVPSWRSDLFMDGGAIVRVPWRPGSHAPGRVE